MAVPTHRLCFPSRIHALFSWLISIHEAVSHLSYTHVVLEAPMVSMNRQLAKEHPIHALFAPHVEGTALINWGAHEVKIYST